MQYIMASERLVNDNMKLFFLQAKGRRSLLIWIYENLLIDWTGFELYFRFIKADIVDYNDNDKNKLNM